VVNDEHNEMVVRGQRGATGQQGEQGDAGEAGQRGERGERGTASARLPAAQARAVVYLFLLDLLFVAACFAGLVYYVHATDQERCTTLEQIVSIPVPHPVVGNPSRQFDAHLEAIERERGRQLGCRP
jgi:hypothetical protein